MGEDALGEREFDHPDGRDQVSDVGSARLLQNLMEYGEFSGCTEVLEGA
jgi:hypothetical protein